MGNTESAGNIDRAGIEMATLEILKDLTADWDTDYAGDIGPDTLLIEELAFESIDVVQLVVSLESRFQRRDMPFEKLLMNDGRYVDDIKVRQIFEFLEETLTGASHG
ncbi:MAG: acyl carrier protein [Acidobacteriota bacterium]|nr:acyl carrier protein [Acidobacteriota bacterium]